MFSPTPSGNFSLWPQLQWESTYQFDSLLCSFFSAESDKGVASVQATQRIHHQAQVPDGTSFLKQRNQLILKKVSGDFAYKYLPGWVERLQCMRETLWSGIKGENKRWVVFR